MDEQQVSDLNPAAVRERRVMRLPMMGESSWPGRLGAREADVGLVSCTALYY